MLRKLLIALYACSIFDICKIRSKQFRNLRMPFATFTKIREVSSEDDVHLAENLIKNQPGKKWKTKNPGEKSAHVILEMSECEQITGIDIGNEHSAFVEVLVGKSSCAPEDFTEILITCSFMTPLESKSSNNVNRVRCFNQASLSPSAVNNKWSLVKVICTQPFNKHVSYGLSFIKVHVHGNEKSKAAHKNLIPDEFLNTVVPNNSQHSGDNELMLMNSTVGKLKFREDSPDSENENSSNLFNRWKKSKDIKDGQTTAASIRSASKNPMQAVRHVINETQKAHTSSSAKSNENIRDRNREKLLFSDDDNEGGNENQEKLVRLSKQIEADKERRRVERENEIDKSKRKSSDSKGTIENLKCEEEKISSCSTKNSTNIVSYCDLSTNRKNKRKSSPLENMTKKMKSTKKMVPFNQLLNGVVLVISGIQNPDRANLRTKAIALGAKYKSDWDSTCTHLICAFKSTPKYKQVKGRGKIVTRSWLEQCYSLRKYLPWRRYALDSNDLSKVESDEEIYAETLQYQTDETDNDTDLTSTSTRKCRRDSEERENILVLYDNDEKPEGNCLEINDELPSESDTDDEIKRTQQSDEKITISKNGDIYEVSTDEEDYLKEKRDQMI